MVEGYKQEMGKRAAEEFFRRLEQGADRLYISFRLVQKCLITFFAETNFM